MAQFHAIAVGHAQDGGLGQEAAGPAGLPLPPAEEAGAFGQFGEQVAIVVSEPIIEAAAADVLDGVEHADGDQLADREDRLGMPGSVAQGVVDLAVQFGDKIDDVHGVPPLWRVSTHSIVEPRGIFKIHSN